MSFSSRWLALFLSLVCVAFSQAGPISPPTKAENAGPLIEKSNVFIGGKGGYINYRIPSIAVSNKGTILAFSEARKDTGSDWDVIDIVSKRSFDNGKTWQPMQVVAGNGVETMNQPTLVVDRSTGTIWLAFCRKNHQMLITRSVDDGVTWSKPEDITQQVTEPTWHYFGAGPGHGIQLKNGRLLVPAWGDGAPLGPDRGESFPPTFGNIQFSFTFYSDDHGVTWKRGGALESDKSDECEVVQAADGRVYMNMRSRKGRHQRAYAWSSDGGVSWSKVAFDARLPEPECEGSLTRFTEQPRFERNRILFANPASSVDRAGPTVRISYDEGLTWPLSKVVETGKAEYSDLAIAPDMSILCLYEVIHPSDWQEYLTTHHIKRGDDSRLVLARFNLQWLTSGKDHLSF